MREGGSNLHNNTQEKNTSSLLALPIDPLALSSQSIVKTLCWIMQRFFFCLGPLKFNPISQGYNEPPFLGLLIYH